ncbi:MAG: UDP-N-acetylglucosamine 4,6-dehydratase (inverting) [Planctomycetes bacterium]|nr:UDP-N-acetylglucosamine 4,6-dehydratase (inverting) [Planctomycetota bacterium]
MPFHKNCNILITGGTGSFGKKFVEIFLNKYSPRRLVVFSRDEQKHVEMMRNHFPQDKYPQIRYFVGDVRDLSRLQRAFAGIDYVVHAAAMKHVDIAEYNPQECIATNVNGANNVISAAIDCGVKKVVALSTDKAANPINLYGATKLCSDKLFVAANSLAGAEGTRFAVVRYGNVIGSKGSVVPFFIKKRKTGVLPVTDPRMTRFWISLDQGVDLVLKAFDVMHGGELFVLKIPSMKMLDLANAIGPDCEIENIGIRPGEKLHECMISEDDARQTLEFDEYYIIEPAFPWWRQNDNSNHTAGKRCPDGFSYTSNNNNHWLTLEQLKVLIEPFEKEAAN